jgi:hypothetical protein
MTARGYEKDKRPIGKVYLGLGLAANEDPQ